MLGVARDAMSENKPIFVISDMHIGDGGKRDNFAAGDRRRQLMTFLDYVERENGELIILGDLFEFWQINLSRVLTNKENLQLMERLAQLKSTYIIGNHDIDLVGFIGDRLLSPALFQSLSNPFCREIGDKTFYFMHGHEVDPYNTGENPTKGRMLTIAAGIAEDLLASPKIGDQYTVEVILEKAGGCVLAWLKRRLWRLLYFLGIRSTSIKNQLSPAQNLTHAMEMLKHYKNFRDESKAEGKEYHTLIVGHTHVPGRIDNWYFNTGSWATTDNNFVKILPSGDAQVFDWNNGDPKTNNTILKLPEPTKETKLFLT